MLPPLRGSEISRKIGGKEPEVRENLGKAAFSKHKRINIFIKSPKLWLPTQDLHKIKPVSIGMTRQPLSLAEEQLLRAEIGRFH